MNSTPIEKEISALIKDRMASIAKAEALQHKSHEEMGKSLSSSLDYKNAEDNFHAYSEELYQLNEELVHFESLIQAIGSDTHRIRKFFD